MGYTVPLFQVVQYAPLRWVFYSTTCEAFIRDGLVRRLTSLR